MINRVLNYGRHLVERYLELSLPYQSVLDLGAEVGDDLMLAKRLNLHATLCAMEVYPDYVHKLIEQKVLVHSINIENESFVSGFTKKNFLDFIQSCFPSGYELKAFNGSNFYPFPPVIARPLASLFPTMAWGIFFVFEKMLPFKNQFIVFPDKKKLETNFYVGA